MDKQIDEKIREKGKEIAGMLEEWAIEDGVLAPGQRIVFSMQIKDGPVVVQEEHSEQTLGNPYLDMHPKEFFSRKRAREKCPHASGRILNLMDYALGELNYDRKGTVVSLTMRDFLEKYPDIRSFYSLSCVGERTISVIVRLLLDAQLPFTDDEDFLAKHRCTRHLMVMENQK